MNTGVTATAGQSRGRHPTNSAARRLARAMRHVNLVIPHWVERAMLRSERHREGARSRLPMVSIIGPPRSGTTLMFQLLLNHYDFVYFDNLQHALARYPLLGSRLSHRIGGGQVVSDYRSQFGYQPGLKGPSEGNFFWDYWFDMTLEAHEPSPRPGRVQHVKRFFDRLEPGGAPFLVPYNAHAFYMEELTRHFATVLFVNMRREPVANAVSILEARRNLRESESEWWSVKPTRSDTGAGAHEQVASQLLGVYQAINQQRRNIGRSNIIDINYQDLCTDPGVVLAAIEQRAGRAGIGLRKKAGNSFPNLTATTHTDDRLAPDAEHFRALFADIDWGDLWARDP